MPASDAAGEAAGQSPDDTPAAKGAKGQEAGTAADSVKKPNGEALSKAEMSLLRELQKADRAVKAHEMAHLAAAGGYARGGATFSYQRGPDGQSYAVGGEVQIDTGKEATPEATIVKMQIVRQAALAPADPSPQDQRVAAHATLQIAEAGKELLASRVARSDPAKPPSAEAAEDTARGVYQQAGYDIERGAADRDATVPPKKAFSAYLALRPAPSGPGLSSAIDQIA